MQTSEQIDQIATALAKAQAEMKPAMKDATNPHFKSKYADLSAVWEAIRAPLSKHGIAAIQEATTADDGVAVTTRLTHQSGQWIQFGPLTVPAQKRDAHGVGSATSYARRYALSAAVGVVSDEDDDGAATAKSVAGQAQAAPPKPAKDPEGFADWLFDLEMLAAEYGTDRLQDAWKKSKPEFRTFAATHKANEWAAIKNKAAAVDAKAAAKVTA